LKILSSLIREPNPPAKITVFMLIYNFACKITQKIPYMQAYRDYFAKFLIFVEF